MKKKLKRIALLALAVLVVVLLHIRVRQEKAAMADKPGDETEQPAAEADAADTQSMAVLRMGEGVALGRIEENEARGGVNVIVTKADGSEETYTFTDVAADSWYANAVNFVVSAGLMTGVGDGDVFQPEYGMLRENFAAILYRFAKGEPVEPRLRFEDVPEDAWFYHEVSWVANENLMSALTPGVFGVGKYMTCEQALIGLYRVAGKPKTDGSLEDYPYAAKVSESGRNAVDWAWKNGLITEVECVWYPPQAISRAQVALLLMRYSAMA